MEAKRNKELLESALAYIWEHSADAGDYALKLKHIGMTHEEIAIELKWNCDLDMGELYEVLEWL